MRNENCSTFKKQVVSCSFTQWYWLLDLTWKQLEFPNASIRSKAFEHLQQNIGTFRPACVIIIIIGVLINVITHNFSVENRLVNITQIQNITPDLNLNIDLFCLPAVWNCGSFRLNQKLLDNFKLIDCVQRAIAGKATKPCFPSILCGQCAGTSDSHFSIAFAYNCNNILKTLIISKWLSEIYSFAR